MRLLYVDSDGVVRLGYLETAEGQTYFKTRSGGKLSPDCGATLLACRIVGEDERAILIRAAEAGYRVETL